MNEYFRSQTLVHSVQSNMTWKTRTVDRVLQVPHTGGHVHKRPVPVGFPQCHHVPNDADSQTYWVRGYKTKWMVPPKATLMRHGNHTNLDGK